MSFKPPAAAALCCLARRSGRLLTLFSTPKTCKNVSQTHLLQQHRVVSLECLEDVMIAAHLPQSVDRCIAVSPTCLPAYAEGILREGCGVRLETSTATQQTRD